MFDERRTQEFILLLGEKGVTRNYVSRAYTREIQVAFASVRWKVLKPRRRRNP